MASDVETSLYKRIGGYDVIAAFTDQWLGQGLLDPRLAIYFKGMSNDTKGKARQLIVDFIAASFGGPVIYTGRNMKILHEGLGITGDEYDLLVGYAATTLDNLGVPAREKAECLSWFSSLRGDIIEQH
jgi:hemoglobin